jgi:hypothetical protein
LKLGDLYERQKTFIDFNRLVLANPKLQELSLVGHRIGNRYALKDTRRKRYPMLKKVQISSPCINSSLLSIVLPQLTHLKELGVDARVIACDKKTFDPGMLQDYKAFLKESNIYLDGKLYSFKYDLLRNDNKNAYK